MQGERKGKLVFALPNRSPTWRKQHLLAFTGAARITVSTYSTGEEFLRKLIALRHKGVIRSAHLFSDFKAAEKTARVNPMLRAAYDEVRFCQNHSKVMVIEGDLASPKFGCARQSPYKSGFALTGTNIGFAQIRLRSAKPVQVRLCSHWHE